MYSQFVKIIGSTIGVGIIVLLGYFMFFRNKDVPGNSSVPEEFSQTKSIERRSAENKGILLAGNAGSPQKTGFQYLFQPAPDTLTSTGSPDKFAQAQAQSPNT